MTLSNNKIVIILIMIVILLNPAWDVLYGRTSLLRSAHITSYLALWLYRWKENPRDIFLQMYRCMQLIQLHIPYRTKVWWEKSLVNLANFTKSPNFICQTSYNSTTIVSILTFLPNFIRQIDFLHFRQTFLPSNFCPIR